MSRRGSGQTTPVELMERLFDLVILNLLFLLCSLPIVTIGAYLTALHRVLLQIIRGEDAYHVRTFSRRSDGSSGSPPSCGWACWQAGRCCIWTRRTCWTVWRALSARCCSSPP
ncbi:MAG: DUF624 domain-containing protein [Oscillibacter sp.]|nr:DUF624 domain-containing protein [Oscillibacter sp.]